VRKHSSTEALHLVEEAELVATVVASEDPKAHEWLEERDPTGDLRRQAAAVMSITRGRTTGGRFAKGHPGGPGRPRQSVEADYLRTLVDSCSPDAWRGVCERAVADARAGNAKAREWLSRYLLGTEPRASTEAAPRLTELAAEEIAAYDRVAARAQDLRRDQAVATLVTYVSDASWSAREDPSG
jgi:hypothetical protein